MSTLDSVLYIQNASLIETHGRIVESALKCRFPALDIDFASDPRDVVKGAAYDAVIAPTVDWLPSVLRSISNFPWIHFQSAGVDRIWAMDFDKKQYPMSKSSGIHAAPMSEFAMGAMLYFAKRFDQYTMQSMERLWRRTWLDELTGRRVLILGLGRVGQAVADRASAFGMRVDGVRNSAQPIAGVDRVTSLSGATELVREADYVVVTLPLTAETRGFVGPQFLAECKPGAVLVDISRGGVVESEAVLEQINEGVLRGAALDVFPQEPLPPESPLWAHENVLLTPHVSGTTPAYVERVLQSFVRNAEVYMFGGNLPDAVDLTLGY